MGNVKLKTNQNGRTRSVRNPSEFLPTQKELAEKYANYVFTEQDLKLIAASEAAMAAMERVEKAERAETESNGSK